ncbi:acyl-CoA dehydrogenase family protein [Streptomyces sp. NPDC096193]|uniref:acyl-CoA dehydrogenase family protein n=1 Tax=Streptomyces sp. NPDC096193 TaxID=3155821 RepID=UPI00331BAFE3
MDLTPTSEQLGFVRSLEAMLTAADVPSAARAWAAGDRAPGRAVWSRLADAGLFALAAPETYDGVGPLPVELALAFTELGRAAVPGPLVETAVVAALLTGLAELGDAAPAKRLLPGLVAGDGTATLTVAGHGTRALDPDAADLVLVVEPEAADGEAARLRCAPGHGAVRVSADPVRRLAAPLAGGAILASGPHLAAAADRAAALARLLTAAQALGVGLTLLDRTVAHVKQRTQFGVAVGSFQAVKHRLADTLIGLEFARPLLHAAALTLAPADICAAKVTAGEAAYAAAGTALQLHGAVGYTDELDLALWLRKARPLRDAWGAPARCRAEVLAGRPWR